MKKIYTLLMALLALTATAQLPVGMPTPYPPSFDGTMMPLQFPAMAPAIPDSLTPIMVNHVGRHGARFLTSEKKTTLLREALTNAREAGQLTEAGQQLMFLLDRIDMATDGRWGWLDSLGHAEEKEIATRLNRMLPGFFSRGNVMAIASYVPRCTESMYVFCMELRRLNPQLQISASSGPDYNFILRFFDTDKHYSDYLKSGSWKKVYDEYYAANVPLAPAVRVMGQGSGLPDAQLRDLTMRIYGVLQALPSMGMQAPVGQWLSPEEYQACYQVENLRHALQRTATPWSDEPAKAARPLLRDIIESIDVELTDPQARNLIRGLFRFGHAETMMPLLSLMKMPGCTVPHDATAANLADYWNDSFVSPLGANLQVIILSGPSGTIYAATLLNCRPCPPTPDADSFIVPWTRLREHWLKQL